MFRLLMLCRLHLHEGVAVRQNKTPEPAETHRGLCFLSGPYVRKSAHRNGVLDLSAPGAKVFR
jgi:hypothetical protein